MPRLYITLLDQRGEHEDSDPIDLCRDCYEYVELMDDAEILAEFRSFAPGSNQCVDLDCDHPCYVSEEDYDCRQCGAKLGGDDQ